MQQPEFHYGGADPEPFFKNAQGKAAIKMQLKEKYLHDAVAFRTRVIRRLLGLTGEQHTYNWMKFDVSTPPIPGRENEYNTDREILVLSSRVGWKRPPAIRIITNEIYGAVETGDKTYSFVAEESQIFSEDFVLDPSNAAQFAVNVCLNTVDDVPNTGAIIFNFASDGDLMLSSNFSSFPKIGAIENGDEEAITPFGFCAHNADMAAALKDGMRLYAETDDIYPACAGSSDE